MESVLGFDDVAPAVVASLGVAVVKAELVAGSVANEDFRVDLADGRRVFVKVGPRAELAAETWAITRAAAAGVPVPRVIAYGDGPASSIPFLVLDLLPSDGNLTTGVLEAVGRAMKTAHTIAVPGYGPIRVQGDPFRPETVAGQYSSWQEFVASILQDIDELVGIDLLTAQQSAQIHRSADVIKRSPLAGVSGVLLHGDVKRLHVMAVDGQLTGVIDWGDASAGDPAWDLARASMMDPAEFKTIASSYGGADGAEVGPLLPIYRALWNARALIYEYRAGGDWFAEYQRRIRSELHLL